MCTAPVARTASAPRYRAVRAMADRRCAVRLPPMAGDMGCGLVLTMAPWFSSLVAAAATAAAGARRRAGHLGAGGGNRVPTGAERVHALAVGVTGVLVACEGVERVAVVGHLRLAIGAGRGAEHRGA